MLCPAVFERGCEESCRLIGRFLSVCYFYKCGQLAHHDVRIENDDVTRLKSGLNQAVINLLVVSASRPTSAAVTKHEAFWDVPLSCRAASFSSASCIPAPQVFSTLSSASVTRLEEVPARPVFQVSVNIKSRSVR